jgi:hypothetical protein
MSADEYVAFLMSNVSGNSCTKVATALQVSHDEVNRFLVNGQYTGRDLFEFVRDSLQLQGGVLSTDDSVLDKPYTRSGTTPLVGKFWSGKHHRTVQGINLIVLVYTQQGRSIPVNFRLYNKADGLTKNAYFQQMVREVWQWGLRPAWVTTDSWYCSLENLKFLRNLEIGVLMGLEKNRLVSGQPGDYQQVGRADIPASGLLTHLKGFDFVLVFRTVDKDGDVRHYLLYHPDREYAQLHLYTQACFERVHLAHWEVENLFRGIKQVCQAERFFVRLSSAITTHVYSVLRAFQKLVAMRRDGLVESIYSLRDDLYRHTQRGWLEQFA